MTTIELCIDRLVLDGLPLDQRQAREVQAAVERQLGHLLATSASPPALESGGGAVQMLSGGTVGWKAASGPGALGEQVGAAVYRSIDT